MGSTARMFWVVDRSLSREPGGERLLAALEQTDSAFSLVRKPPFADYLVGLDHDEPIELRLEGPVFAIGTTSLGLVSAKMGWIPGHIDAPGMDQALEVWGKHMLNHAARTGPIAFIEVPREPFFIRPVEDSKAFAGTVMDKASFEGWRAALLKMEGYTTLPPETEVMIAPVRSIDAEYRCMVADGRVVTASRYKSGERVFSTPGAPDTVLAFAQARVNEWNPRPALVLDIAETDDGPKIIETNSVSSSGFYQMDMILFVKAINALVS